MVNVMNKGGQNTKKLFSQTPQRAELTALQHQQAGPFVELGVSSTPLGGHFKCICLTTALKVQCYDVHFPDKKIDVKKNRRQSAETFRNAV